VLLFLFLANANGGELYINGLFKKGKQIKFSSYKIKYERDFDSIFICIMSI